MRRTGHTRTRSDSQTRLHEVVPGAALLFQVNTTPDRCRRAAGEICGSRIPGVWFSYVTLTSPISFDSGFTCWSSTTRICLVPCVSQGSSRDRPLHDHRFARRGGIEPRASLEFNRRATNVKKCFVPSLLQVPSPSDFAGEPPRVNLIRPAPSRDAIDRERVYGAGITGDARVVHPRAVLLAKSHFPRLKVTHMFATASHAARTSSGGAATPKSFSKCS